MRPYRLPFAAILPGAVLVTVSLGIAHPPSVLVMDSRGNVYSGEVLKRVSPSGEVSLATRSPADFTPAGCSTHMSSSRMARLSRSCPSPGNRPVRWQRPTLIS